MQLKFIGVIKETTNNKKKYFDIISQNHDVIERIVSKQYFIISLLFISYSSNIHMSMCVSETIFYIFNGLPPTVQKNYYNKLILLSCIYF